MSQPTPICHRFHGMPNRRHQRLRAAGLSVAAKHKQQGLSLIEVMVALTLSLLLILGMVSVFTSSRAAFDATVGVSHSQENSRFAIDFIQRDIRMAGHMGCLNEYGHFNVPEQRFFSHFVGAGVNMTNAPNALRLDLPMEVFDYRGTTPEDTSSAAPYTMPDPPALAAANNNYIPALPAALGLAGVAVQGSDVVVVRYLADESFVLDGLGVNANTVDLPLANAASIVADRANNRGVYGVTNCKNLSLFQATSDPGGTGAFGAAVANLNLGPWTGREVYGSGSRLHRLVSVVYYIGLDAEGAPALFRKRLDTSAANAWGATEVVVPHVDQMQIMAGVDNTQPRDDTVDAYYSPSAVPARATTAETMAAISSLRIGLLMRAPLIGGGGVRDVDEGSLLLSDVWVRPPADTRVRNPYETLIAVRNRIRN